MSGLIKKTWIFVIFFLAYSGIVHAEGVHIIVIRPSPGNTLEVAEFIDNPLVEKIANLTGNEGMLHPSVRCDEDPASTVKMISADVVPVMVFFENEINVLEDRIINSSKGVEENRQEIERRNELVDGLFRIPAWPFLAASEVPLYKINIDRAQQLPLFRAEQFPIAVFASKTRLPIWNVAQIIEEGAKIGISDQFGSGYGIGMRYVIKCDYNRVSVEISQSADAGCVYIVDGPDFRLDVKNYRIVSPSDMAGSLEPDTAWRKNITLLSSEVIRDDKGKIDREIVNPSEYGIPDVLKLISSGSDNESGNTASERRLNPIVTVAICWAGYGLIILLLNFVFGFSPRSTVDLFIYAITTYPLIVLISFLLGGLWGMGFIPGALGAARFYSIEGKRVSAFLVTLAAIYAVSLISSLITSRV